MKLTAALGSPDSRGSRPGGVAIGGRSFERRFQVP